MPIVDRLDSNYRYRDLYHHLTSYRSQYLTVELVLALVDPTEETKIGVWPDNNNNTTLIELKIHYVQEK